MTGGEKNNDLWLVILEFHVLVFLMSFLLGVYVCLCVSFFAAVIKSYELRIFEGDCCNRRGGGEGGTGNLVAMVTHAVGIIAMFPS